ncbi:hypothetical protein BGX34_005673 [Mortierella sp. NVP85]|nr:hypothetical protein BGX34_005673 [Mortierella sp. NVP85]
MSKPTLIVTGASRGIGKSIVHLAIRNLGANVIGVARSRDALEQISQDLSTFELADRFKFVVGDVTKAPTAEEAVELAKKSWNGQIDGLVVNAGNFDINFFSVLTLVQLALPSLRQSNGRVILVSSGAANNTYHGWGAYCTAKAALKMFGETLAKEESQVTTVSIRPGIVDTEMQAAIRAKGQGSMTPGQHADFIGFHTNKKLLHPDEPGHVIAALAVGGPSSLSGQFLSWDDESLKAYRK